MSFLKILLTLVLPTRLSIAGGGGGDGGAQAEADRVRVEDSQREYQIAQDKAKINALFGITDYDYTTLPDLLYQPEGGGVASALDSRTKFQTEVDRLTGLIDSGNAVAGGVPEGGEPVDGIYRDTQSTQSTADLLAAAQASLDEVNSIFGDYDPEALSGQATTAFNEREATLSGIYDDLFSKYNYEQDRQYDRKEADVRAMLAERGLSRSSTGQSVFDRLGEIRDTNTTGFEEGASNAVSNIRIADTQTLENLIAQIDAGGDYNNARTTALSDLTNNVDASLGVANARDLTNLFAGMDELYGQKQYVDAYNQGQRTGSSNIVTPGSGTSSSGSIINIG